VLELDVVADRVDLGDPLLNPELELWKWMQNPL
jgi:hypothetical protein